MVPLYTVAFPVFSAEQRAQIDELRGLHDARNARMIAPHFTLVFACSALEEHAYLNHVRPIAASTPRIVFACREVEFHAAPEGDGVHVYLVPDSGASSITLLHDALYQGPLAPCLRHDLPYLPHITIGRVASQDQAKGLCDFLNARGLSFEGGINALSIGSLREERFRTHATCALRNDAIVR